MEDLKIIALSVGSGLLSLLLFKELFESYETGISYLKFGNSISIAENPIAYWFSMSISLFLACLFLYAAIQFFRILLGQQ